MGPLCLQHSSVFVCLITNNRPTILQSNQNSNPWDEWSHRHCACLLSKAGFAKWPRHSVRTTQSSHSMSCQPHCRTIIKSQRQGRMTMLVRRFSRSDGGKKHQKTVPERQKMHGHSSMVDASWTHRGRMVNQKEKLCDTDISWYHQRYFFPFRLLCSGWGA